MRLLQLYLCICPGDMTCAHTYVRSRQLPYTRSCSLAPYHDLQVLTFAPVLSQGACGYGDLSDAAAYPFFSAVGIPTNSDIMSFPTMGCGTCIEFECVNDRTPAYAVSLLVLPVVQNFAHAQSLHRGKDALQQCSMCSTCRFTTRHHSEPLSRFGSYAMKGCNRQALRIHCCVAFHSFRQAIHRLSTCCPPAVLGSLAAALLLILGHYPPTVIVTDLLKPLS